MTETLQEIMNEKVDIAKLKRTKRFGKPMYIRPTPEISEWMRKNFLSPTKIFNTCAQILMERDRDAKKSN